MIKTVVAMSRDRAQKLSPKDVGEHAAIISICSTHEQSAILQEGFDKTLRTAFNMVPGSFRKEGDRGPSNEVIDEILGFLAELDADTKSYNLVVHCGEGRCRSVAVAHFTEHRYDAEASTAEPNVTMGIGSVSLWKDLERLYREKSRTATLTP